MYVLPLIGISRQAYREAVHTGKELDWCCKSCTESSYISAEPVAESSRLEMSTIYEPLHPTTHQQLKYHGDRISHSFCNNNLRAALLVSKILFIYLSISQTCIVSLSKQKKKFKKIHRDKLYGELLTSLCSFNFR